MKKTLLLLLLVVLAIIALSVKQCNTSDETERKPTLKDRKETIEKENDNSTIRGLNRHPSNINYSRHAHCRMGCRHIDEAEVQQILKDGKINYSKSELKGDDCKKKYAIEGNTKDKQKVRIIFAPCADEVTVVTVIDLGKEWACDCE